MIPAVLAAARYAGCRACHVDSQNGLLPFEHPTAAGMPVTSVRELRVLQTCKHPNLVELKRVVTGVDATLLECVLDCVLAVCAADVQAPKC